MPLLIWIGSNKRWSLIIILSILYLVQIGYTNHLAGKINESDHKCNEQIQKLERAQVEALAKQQDKVNKVSADYEKLRSERSAKVETVTRTVQKIVERPIYLNRCIDDDGLQQINGLIETRNSS